MAGEREDKKAGSQSSLSPDKEQKIQTGREIFETAFSADTIPEAILASDEDKEKYTKIVSEIRKILEGDRGHHAYQAIADKLIPVECLKSWIADIANEKNPRLVALSCQLFKICCSQNILKVLKDKNLAFPGSSKDSAILENPFLLEIPNIARALYSMEMAKVKPQNALPLRIPPDIRKSILNYLVPSQKIAITRVSKAMQAEVKYSAEHKLDRQRATLEKLFADSNNKRMVEDTFAKRRLTSLINSGLVKTKTYLDLGKYPLPDEKMQQFMRIQTLLNFYFRKREDDELAAQRQLVDAKTGEDTTLEDDELAAAKKAKTVITKRAYTQRMRDRQLVDAKTGEDNAKEKEKPQEENDLEALLSPSGYFLLSQMVADRRMTLPKRVESWPLSKVIEFSQNPNTLTYQFLCLAARKTPWTLSECISALESAFQGKSEEERKSAELFFVQLLKMAAPSYDSLYPISVLREIIKWTDNKAMLPNLIRIQNKGYEASEIGLGDFGQSFMSPDVDEIRRGVRDFGHHYIDLVSLLTRPEYFELIISKVFNLNQLMGQGSDNIDSFFSALVSSPSAQELFKSKIIPYENAESFLTEINHLKSCFEHDPELDVGYMTINDDELHTLNGHMKIQAINATYRDLWRNRAYLNFPNYNSKIQVMREACYNWLKKRIELSENPEELQVFLEKDENGTKPESFFLLLNHKNLKRSYTEFSSSFSPKNYYAECVALVENRIKAIKLQESKEEPKPEK